MAKRWAGERWSLRESFAEWTDEQVRVTCVPEDARRVIRERMDDHRHVPEKLGVEVILVNSPQAEGRVERMGSVPLVQRDAPERLVAVRALSTPQAKPRAAPSAGDARKPCTGARRK